MPYTPIVVPVRRRCRGLNVHLPKWYAEKYNITEHDSVELRLIRDAEGVAP